MDLDKTWKNCMSMWRWVSENWKPGMNVDILKDKWLSKHGFVDDDRPTSGCFFCGYTNKRGCDNCPGVLVDASFGCHTLKYEWNVKPRKFYLKLRRLNYARLKRG